MIFIAMMNSYAQSSITREEFVQQQNAYFQKLSLEFYQNKEYQIITRNFDKQVMSINLSDAPKGLKKKRIKKLEKEKNKKMKGVLNARQYKLYLKRQKEISKTLDESW